VEEETPGNNGITCRSVEFSFGVLSGLSHSRTRGSRKSYRNFFSRASSCLNLIRVCFFETGVLSACLRFSIPAYSPRDKRGKVGSRNRGLGITIRADNGRFF
jgi:hypothetical protein